MPDALVGFDPRHALASALAVGATAGVSARLRAVHPPALATTLVASLGFLPLAKAWALLAGSALVAGGMAWMRSRARRRGDHGRAARS